MQPLHPQLTPEQRQAIGASGGLPILVEDPHTHKTYVLVEQPQGLALEGEYIEGELSKGIASPKADRRIVWDSEGIKQDGRRRIVARTTSG
jgi:hypothetical protein